MMVKNNIYFKLKNKCKLCYIYSFFYTFNLINVTTIEYSAFRDSQLTSVTIPDSVRIIYGYSFRNNNITEVTIPDTVEILACNAFDEDTIIHKSDSLVCNDSCEYTSCA